MRTGKGVVAIFISTLLLAAGCAEETAPGDDTADGAATPTDVADATEEPAGTGEPTGTAEPTETGGDGESVYAGERVRIIHSWDSGGLGDVYSRILARHLPNHIAGEPSMFVEAMPGGGHNLAANYLFNRAEADGLTFGIFASHRIVADIIDEEGVEFEAQEFNWLGSLTALPGVCVAWHETGLTSYEDLQSATDPWVLGSPSPGAIANVGGTMMADDLGLPIDVILGYEGQGDIVVAMQQGEVEGLCSGWETILDVAGEFVESGELIPIFVAGTSRLDALPDVPAMTEFEWSEEYDAAVNAWLGRFDITVPVAAPPGVPEDRVQILRDGIAATIDDPAYLEEIEQAQQLSDNPLNGEETAQVVDDLFAAPDSAWEIIEEAQTPE